MTRDELISTIQDALVCDGADAPEYLVAALDAGKVIAAITAAGLAIVPVEPTAEQLSAGNYAASHRSDAKVAYRTMIAAGRLS